ncbi:Linear gramicidin synthase subunit B [compost metagenome]
MALKLKGISGETGNSLFMVLLSAFKLLTYFFTSQLDIVIGSPISQRNREDFENMISDFSNMLLYRTLLNENDSLYDVMAKVKKTALGAYENKDVPSQAMFDALKPDVDPAYSSLFQMMFVFHQIFPNEQEQFLEGLNTSYLNVERKSSQFDISLFMFDDEQAGLYGKFEYNPELYSRETILKFIHHFKVVLRIMVEMPHLKVCELSSRISSMNQMNSI